MQLFKADRVKVRFLQSIASTEGWSFDTGDVHEFDAVTARNFVNGQVAEPVDDSTPLGRAPTPLACPACDTRHPGTVSVCTVCAGLRGLDTTTRTRPPGGRPVKAFNPVARPDSQLFLALLRGEHAVHGFANRHLRAKLADRLRGDPRPHRARSAACSTASTSMG
jgi:hypothetical protein